MTAALLVGTTGVVLNQIFIWPQVLRALRTVEGVATLTLLTGLLARALWSVYGIALSDAALVVGNVTVASGFLVLLVLVALRRQGQAPVLLAGGAGVTGLVVVASLAGEAVLGWAAVVTAAVVNLPQMARALLDRHRLAGVSVPTYLLIAAASTCWLTYGVLTRRPLISAPHLLLLPTALVIAATAYRSQRATRRTATGAVSGSPPDEPPPVAP